MAQRPTLNVTLRENFGKGFARRARAAGKIPAVIYGHGTDPVHVELPGHDTFLIVKDNPNAVISIKGLEKDHLALVKDMQRHPVRRDIMHVDLLLVKADEKVEVEVPVIVTGEPAPGATAVQELLNIVILAPVADIPEHIEIDVEGKEDGTVLTVADLKTPSDVEISLDPEEVVLSVTIPQMELPEEEEGAEGAEGEAATEASADGE